MSVPAVSPPGRNRFPCPGHVCCCCFCCDVTSFSCFSKGSSWLPSEFPRPEPGTSTDAKEELPSESFLFLLLLLFFCLPYSRLQLPFLLSTLLTTTSRPHFNFSPSFLATFSLPPPPLQTCLLLFLFQLPFSFTFPVISYFSTSPSSYSSVLFLLTLWFSVILESKRNISCKLLHFSFIFISFYKEKVPHYERAASPACLTGNLCQNPVR